MKLCFLLLILLISCSFVQGWQTNLTHLNDSYTSINWNGVTGPYRFSGSCSSGKGKAWSVGGQGHIVIQEIIGARYESREYSFPDKVGEAKDDSFYGVWADSRGNGWVVGGSGRIYRTKDNGHSWFRVLSGTGEHLRAVTCTEVTRCWILGEKTLFRTTEQGNGWQPVADIEADLIDFVDSKIGWIAKGDSDLWTTSDGGVTWSQLTLQTNIAERNYVRLFDALKFIDSRFGWAGGWEKVGYTPDGGKTWRVTEIKHAKIIGIVATDKKKALAVNRGNYNYCTDDAGRSWKECYPAEWEKPKVASGWVPKVFKQN